MRSAIVESLMWDYALSHSYTIDKNKWHHFACKGRIPWRISARAEISARLGMLKFQPGPLYSLGNIYKNKF